MKEFIFSKVEGLQPGTLLKNELLYKYFSRILLSFSEITSLRNISECLFLKILTVVHKKDLIVSKVPQVCSFSNELLKMSSFTCIFHNFVFVLGASISRNTSQWLLLNKTFSFADFKATIHYKNLH